MKNSCLETTFMADKHVLAVSGYSSPIFMQSSSEIDSVSQPLAAHQDAEGTPFGMKRRKLFPGIRRDYIHRAISLYKP